MALDYPLYKEMVRLGSRGRWFWRIGNWLRFAGVLGIVLVLIVWPVVFFFKFGHIGISFLVTLVLLGLVFMLGNLLKRVSYQIAFGEGIDIVKFIETSPEKKS